MRPPLASCSLLSSKSALAHCSNVSYIITYDALTSERGQAACHWPDFRFQIRTLPKLEVLIQFFQLHCDSCGPMTSVPPRGNGSPLAATHDAVPVRTARYIKASVETPSLANFKPRLQSLPGSDSIRPDTSRRTHREN